MNCIKKNAHVLLCNKFDFNCNLQFFSIHHFSEYIRNENELMR